MKSKALLTIVSLVILFTNSYGTIINVPGDAATIQAGIDGAMPGDTVLVAEGHYYERLNFLGKDILLTSEYLYTGNDLTIQNTIIDGEESKGGAKSDTMCVIMFCSGETSNAVIQGFTIQNGQGWKNAYNRWLGGGIMCIAASPTITHNIIRQNSVAHNGGGLCGINEGSDPSDVTVTYNTFTANTASGGGAMMFAESAPVISYNDIVGNFAADSTYLCMGGGIWTYKCASTITHNTIRENTAALGGGICCYVLATDWIAYNEITLNSATGDSAFGGGISCFHTYSGTITENTISDNTAAGGGGIHVYLSNAIPGEDAFITDNIITGNTADGSVAHRGGGGVMFEYTYDSTPGLFTGNLLTHNTAPNGGGGAIAFWEGFYGPIESGTIAYNSAMVGGALYSNWSQPAVSSSVINTICWADTGTVAGNEIWTVGATWFYVTYCDVDGGYTGPGIDTTNIDCDPQFCDPITGNYNLNNASCCAGAGFGGVDIGAFGVGCSQYVCGDIDGSGGDIDIADLVYLVDYMFNDGPPPPTMDAADFDGDDEITIADLVYLVDYMFNDGPPPECG